MSKEVKKCPECTAARTRLLDEGTFRGLHIHQCMDCGHQWPVEVTASVWMRERARQLALVCAEVVTDGGDQMLARLEARLLVALRGAASADLGALALAERMRDHAYAHETLVDEASKAYHDSTLWDDYGNDAELAQRFQTWMNETAETSRAIDALRGKK